MIAADMSNCCDGSVSFTRHRVFTAVKNLNSNKKQVLRTRLNGDQNIVEFKALAKRAGLTRNYDVKVGLLGTHSPIGQAIQSIGSAAIPGNLSPFRSPVRSGVFGALTPGKPRIPGGTGGSNRSYRCPEGYQYGGRFTDNRLSTCGAQLFDIPSPLGSTVAKIRKVGRAISGVGGSSTAATGAPIKDPLIDARRPQIPRVSNPNPKALALNAKDMIRQMGLLSTPVSRLVRRDGFVLEPVVSAQVLRAIPDNRDMEGANYIMLATKLQDMGGQELGLLSNTGVTKLTYVLPGGSSVSLEKKRPLTVGERRKLGRTVNAASKIDVTSNPTARLKEVVVQTGDGIGYSESFVNITNPNEPVSKNGKTIPKWADEVFGKGKKAIKKTESERETVSKSQIGESITSIDEAVDHISSGGSLSEIDPSILQEAITKANIFKVQKLDASREIVTAPDGRKYIQYSSSNDFEHISQKFSSAIQQHLGLESPDVFFVGSGNKRKYITEEPGSIMRGFKVDRRKTLKDYSPQDVAKMMISDWLTDERNREPGSVVSVSNGEVVKPVVTGNTTSGLVGLDKIQIVKRQKMAINDFFSGDKLSLYADYFQNLQQQQRFAFRKEIDALLLRARKFNFTQFKNRLYGDGKLTDAEKTHLNIVGKILEQRIEIYANSKQTLMEILGAKK